MNAHSQNRFWRMGLVVALLSSGCSYPTSQTPVAKDTLSQAASNDRLQFVKKLSQVRDGDSEEQVVLLLGKPDDIRPTPDPVRYPTDEIWGYGCEGHSSLATLGSIWIRDDSVVWVIGGYGDPPLPNIITEVELRAGMRFLHPGPEHPGYNDPLHLIRVCNYLQPLGKEKSLAIIGEYVRVNGRTLDETWLFLLLRTLFDVPQPPRHMPAMGIGAMSPAPPKDQTRIPRFPIVIVDDVPFSLLWGVDLGGSPAPVSSHVEYFRKHGTIRAVKLRPPDDPYPSFQKLLASDEWAQISDTADKRWIANYAGHTLLQVLALARTAYDPPEARQPRAYPKVSDYDRHHTSFLEAGSRWDETLQMYVRRDGTHGEVGHLANIYQ